MKLSIYLLLLAATSALAAKSLSSVQRVTNLAIASNRYIVEVAEASNIPSKREAQGTPHERLYQSLKSRKISFEVHREFNSPGIFLGASIALNDVANILGADGVVSVRPVRTYISSKPVFSEVVSRGDPGLPDSQSTHIATGVDKLHEQGITGKGVKIGILDTGIDYTHPALGAGFGPGFKVAGGFDFVGDDYDGSNNPISDTDPLDQCNGHGTHMAGIVGANPGNTFNISGVAYGAELWAYRVVSCSGATADDIIIDALLMGVKDGMDILSMSLGEASGWTEEIIAVVASRIAAMGKVVTISAGNDGPSGSWYTSSPGNAINAITVGSSDNPLIPLQSFDVQGVEHVPIVYYNALPLPISGTKPLYATSNDTNVVDDACNPLPADTPDLSQFVVLVRRGTCSFVQKLTNVAAFGGNASLVYDNGKGFMGPVDVGAFNAALIQVDDGVFLVEQLAAGAHIEVTFPQVGGATGFPLPTGGLVSSFTSYGPTNDLFLKPSITAPGGDILSTLPVPLGLWGVESGTSQAAPFMAGSAALLMEVKGTAASVGQSARTLFQSTARVISSSLTDGDPLQTVTQQGAGLVQPYAAIFTSTLLTPAELLLNDTAHFAGPQKFTVKNVGKTAKAYTLTHVPAGTAVTMSADKIDPALGPVPLTTEYATVTFSKTKFTLGPGQTQEITATITPPRGDASTFPVYSGFIYATSGNDSVHATYMGVAASLRDAHVIDNTDLIFGVNLPVIVDSQGNVQDAPLNYSFVGDDTPMVLWRQAFGTPVLRLDLVPANITLNATLNTRAVPLFSFAHSHSGGTFAKVPILGPLLEMDYLGRNDEINSLDNTFVLSKTFANGTVIPNGSYRVFLRALKVTGDPTNEADYESWLSPIIGVSA